jgi:hypothetical protein
VRVYGLRVLRVFALACVVYAAIVGLRAAGYGRLGLAVGFGCVVLALAYSMYEARRAGRVRREQLWERAIYQPELRDRAVVQLEQALGRLTPITHANRSEHARLSVMLSELLDSQARYDAAIATIDAVELTSLSMLEVGLVRHTRAVTHLRAGDAAGALRALTRRELSGDIELDQRLLLLEAYARIELGEVEWGLATAERIILAPGTHESVVAEARVVRAAGLDAAGRREEALVVLMALGRDILAPLAELGQPRARELAKAALEGSSA